MTEDQRKTLEILDDYRLHLARGTSKDEQAITFRDVYLSYAELLRENEKHEKFTRWLIGELIKGELSEEAVMDKLVEFGFAECRDGYITIKVEI